MTLTVAIICKPEDNDHLAGKILLGVFSSFDLAQDAHKHSVFAKFELETYSVGLDEPLAEWL
jgi:hypothetical protein